MAEEFEENCENNDRHGEIYQEKVYDAFVCPLTKQIMRDPVTIETGYTFDREAILKWFRECQNNGRKLACPLTRKELRSTDLNPSIALRNAIDEWTQRNEAKELDKAHRLLLSSASSEQDALRALEFVVNVSWKRSRAVYNGGLIPTISGLLKSGSITLRSKALEVLRIVAEENNENKEDIGAGDTIRTIVKFLLHEYIKERELAVALLCELSKSESLCEKIGGVDGAILILVGLASSKSENIVVVERAEHTLKNLEKCEKNIKQMAENGRLQPLLTKLLEGSPETQLSMALYLGELILANDVKVLVAQTAGPTLITIMTTGTVQAREATLKALNQISSNESSASVLIEAGILPPLVRDLFAVGCGRLPTRLKEMSAGVLSNLVASGADLEAVPLDDGDQTLLSEDVVHNLLHLISNTGPAIEHRLLQVLVGLTSSPTAVSYIVSGIKSSGAVISLVQFIDAAHTDVRVAALKLLHNISPHMSIELAETLGGSSSHLGTVLDAISDNNGIAEEQAAAIGLLAELPEMDSGLTKQLFKQGAFRVVITKLLSIRDGGARSNRYIGPFQEGLVRVLSRLTYCLAEPEHIAFAKEYDLATVFAGLIEANGSDKVIIASAFALENLSQESKYLTAKPEPPKCTLLSCFSKPPSVSGLCRIHHGFCTAKESFCLLESRAVEKLIACLDHTNEKVVEAALAALCTLLDDTVDTVEGVYVLCEAEGIKPIFDALIQNRTEIIQKRAVWAVERFLRIDDIAREVSGNQSVGSALVEAYRNGDYRTRQIAERALKHIERLPDFSAIAAQS
ncbi:U-box domain-containing protein 44-like [Ananas comosus]|uniref:RING-type E3 ubiquitin transferase n=1 Tax=Ananas comosus TaxID=4615 RepID=A0A6P5H0C8_ANACO|nr:U-box domain-containing protein 44-like [Ananas comosus]XP_020113490.1 U-box domain-containing protein 44-like [Ananas comosus]